jgi:hypothetical protein
LFVVFEDLPVKAVLLLGLLVEGIDGSKVIETVDEALIHFVLGLVLFDVIGEEVVKQKVNEHVVEKGIHDIDRHGDERDRVIGIDGRNRYKELFDKINPKGL